MCAMANPVVDGFKTINELRSAWGLPPLEPVILQPSRLWRLKRWLTEEVYVSWTQLAGVLVCLFLAALALTLAILSR